MSAAHELEPMSDFMVAALHYASKGWRVFPVIPGAKAPPLIQAWQTDASNDPEQVRRFWTKWPDANIAIVCDEHFGFGLDFDDTTIRDFLPALPATLEARTPRAVGGHHVFFLHPPDVRIDNSPKGLRAFVASRGYKPPSPKWEGTVDVRGAGGYVIASPSVRADKGGAIYRWHNAGTPIAPAPDWLVEALHYKPPRAARAAPAHRGGDRTAWLTAALEGESRALAETAKGGRADALNRAAFKLGQRRASLDDVRRYLRAACEVNGYIADDGEDHFERDLARGWEAGMAEQEIGPVDKVVQAQASVKHLRAITGLAPAGEVEGAPRPTIRLGPELHETVDAAVKALVRDRDLYQRDGHLVRVVRIAGPEALIRRGRRRAGVEGDIVPTGTPKILEVPLSTLTERLTRVALFEKFVKREWVATKPPQDFVAAVAARAEWPGVRPLIAVTETPIVRPDFSVRVEPGYDDATGCIYLPSCDLPPLPEAPTRADAQAALDLLCEPFVDFPYRSPADRVVPVAAALTLLARPAIAGAVPGFLLDATTRGSGKSLQADVVALIATGREAPRMSWPRDEGELEKVLGAYALRGASLIMLDNLTSAFGGGPIDRVLTAQDTVELRILGKSEVPTLRWRAVIVATGNNLEVIGDTTRRVLVSRLEPPQDSPEDRTDFRHPDLLAWVREERPRLVAAALTILRAWALAGRPLEGCKTWGSFEAWARVVPPALVWAGGADPMRARLNTEAEDPERAALAGILEGLGRLAPEGITVRALVERLYPTAYLLGARTPDDFTPLRDALEHFAPAGGGRAPDQRRLGKTLSRCKGRWVGGRRLESRPGGGGTVRWLVVNQGGGLSGLSGFNLTPPARDGDDIFWGNGWNEPTQPTLPTPAASTTAPVDPAHARAREERQR